MGELSLFAPVVPLGVATPVQDHLAWGLVGLYLGEQHEEMYAPDPHSAGGSLQLVATNTLTAGEFSELVPLQDDIHRVITTSPEASISLHLLGTDAGCVWRHRYDLGDHNVTPFRSGYTNRSCQSSGN